MATDHPHASTAIRSKLSLRLQVKVLCNRVGKVLFLASISYSGNIFAQNPAGLPAPPPVHMLALDAVVEPLPAAPQEHPFSLAFFEEMALANNPALGEALTRIESARGRWIQGGLLPNPTFGYSGQQIGSRGLAEQDGVVIGQDIIRGGKLRLNRAVADREIFKAEQEAETVRMRVLTDVRVAFYDVLIADRRRALNEELVRIGEKAYSTAEALFKAKEVSRVDVLQAKLETEQARIALQNAQNRYTSVWRGLAAVCGDAHLPARAVSGTLDGAPLDLKWEDSLQRLLGSSPEVATAIANLERSNWALQRARAQTIQNINVQGIVQRDNAIQGWDGALQLTMPLKLFDRNQGGIREAQADVAGAQRSVERVELDLQNRLAAAFERYANARNQVLKYSQDILPSAKESLELTRAGYAAGEFGFLNLLTAQRTFFQANVSYVESLRELWAATWEIEGMLLSNSLQATGK